MMMVVTSDTIGGAMARRLLPAAVLIPLLIGAVCLIREERSDFGAEFGISLFAFSSIVMFTGVIWLNAKLLFVTETRRARSMSAIAAS